MAEPTDWTMRHRDGLPSCTYRMLAVLQTLRAAKQADCPFVLLPGIHKRTLNALTERDWIFESDAPDGTRYTITGRGLKALKVYSEPNRYRTDGLCKDCGRPRKQAKSGYTYIYCDECQKQHNNRAYRLKGNQLKPDGLCARCGKRQRHTYPSGHTIPYCKPCRDRMRKGERKRKQRRLLKRIQEGEHIPCLKCDQPRYVSGNTVQDYCYTHYRTQQRKAALKRSAHYHHPDGRAGRGAAEDDRATRGGGVSRPLPYGESHD